MSDTTETKPRKRKPRTETTAATDAVLTTSTTHVETPHIVPPELPKILEGDGETLDVVAPGEKVLKDFLWEAHQANDHLVKLLTEADSPLREVSTLNAECRKNRKDPAITQAYYALGKALKALEQLVAQRKWTRGGYHDWWSHSRGISPARHTRCLDMVDYLAEDEIKWRSLKEALDLVAERKLKEAGLTKDVVRAANSLTRLSDSMSKLFKEYGNGLKVPTEGYGQHEDEVFKAIDNIRSKAHQLAEAFGF